MADLVSEIERDFPTDVRALGSTLSAPQLAAALKEPWLQQLFYGKAIEKRLDALRRREPQLKDLGYQKSHVFTKTKTFPDWYFSWSNHTSPSDRHHNYVQYVDLTTEPEVVGHQAKYGARSATILTYRRPEGDDLLLLFEGLSAMRTGELSSRALRKQLSDATDGWVESLDTLDAEKTTADFEAWEKELIDQGSAPAPAPAPAPQPESGRPAGRGRRLDEEGLSRHLSR